MARVLILRAEEEALRTARALVALGHAPVIAPVVTCAPTGKAIVPGVAKALIATSARAIRSIKASDAAICATLPLFAVGAATAALAREKGFRNVIEGGGQALTLVETILATIDPPGPLLYLAGEPRRPVVEAELSAAGFDIAAPVLYRMRQAETLPELAIEALAAGVLDAVLHYSAETAALFVSLARCAGLDAAAARTAHLCFSEAVAEAVAALAGSRRLVAETPTETALFALIGALRRP